MILFRFTVAAIVGAAANGCVHDDAISDDAALRKPPMPTMAPAPATAAGRPAKSWESELLAMAIRQARSSEIATSAQTVRTVADPEQRARLGARVATALAGHDPALAATFAAALDAGAVQHEAIEIAANALVRRDPEAALDWSLALSDARVAEIARRAVTDRLVRTNPRDTIDRILARPSGTARDETLGFAAAAWARHDAESAVVWLRDFPAGELKERVSSSIGFEIAQTNPDRAIAIAEMLPAGRDRWLLFATIAQTWVAIDPGAALAWARQLPAGEARQAALAGAETGFGVPSSRTIAAAPSVRGSGSLARGRAAAGALREGDPPTFAAWLANQRRGISREEAILEYVRQRSAMEPGAVGQWVTTLPGAMRDRAMEIYVESLLAGSPSDAADWLSSLPSSDRSDYMIERTARRYLLTNPAPAEDWLRGTSLPEHRKEELLRQAGR